MSNSNDGGPAFPVPPERINDNGNDKHWAYAAPGMSLRDWFAGQALAGICANGEYGKHPKHKDEPWDVSIAAHAYDYADAMLAIRKQETST